MPGRRSALGASERNNAYCCYSIMPACWRMLVLLRQSPTSRFIHARVIVSEIIL